MLREKHWWRRHIHLEECHRHPEVVSQFWEWLCKTQMDIIANAKLTHCWLWFSVVELDSPLAQKAQTCRLSSLSTVNISTSTTDPVHAAQNSAISPQSPTCSSKMASKTLVSIIVLTSSESTLAASFCSRSVVPNVYLTLSDWLTLPVGLVP